MSNENKEEFCMTKFKRMGIAKRLLCMALALVMVCTGITAFADVDPTGEWISDSNELMQYYRYGDAYLSVRGKVGSKWYSSLFDDGSFCPYVLDENNENHASISVIACTPSFIADGQALDLLYTVKNSGTKESKYRPAIWADTAVAGCDNSKNEVNEDRSIITMTCPASWTSPSSDKDVVFFGVAPKDSGLQFKGAFYGDTYPGMDPIAYQENLDNDDTAMFAYWPEATLAAGAEVDYHFIVGMTDADSLKDILDKLAKDPTADDFEFDADKATVTAKDGTDVGTITLYYSDGEGWTTTKPTKPGIYKVGIVTTGSEAFSPVGTAEAPFTNDAWTFEIKKPFKFVDVPKNTYYYDAIKWAADNDIAAGMDETHFVPTMGTTRAQVVTFMWRMAGCPEPTAKMIFSDVPANSYYAKAVTWAIEEGITIGTSKTTFSPDQICTRAQCMTFLYRACGSADVSQFKTHYTDITRGKYYYNAIVWADEMSITNGVDSNAFGADLDCSRAQIVTFLYRFDNLPKQPK